jgi:aminocarboxymuconate-semialdehyde decarboxylase
MVYWAPGAFGLKLCRSFNDACVTVHQAHADRFVGLAMLPMQDPALAVEEFDRVAKLPGIRGIYMATQINGRNLDEKDFWPVYARCEERGFAIFLHPVNPVGADRMGRYHLRNFIGNPTDTAIAAASFIFSGALDAFPKLDIVLPHAGGVFPILIGRWDHGATVRPEVKDLKNAPSHYLRRFHYDTVAHSSPILMNLVKQVGVDRIVAGTDFPADMSDVDPVRTVESLTALSTAERDLILRGNAARLLKLDA